jgi:hypothetical protein
MIRKKTQTATFAVMFTSIGWSIFTTASCVVMDHRKQELKSQVVDCEHNNQLLQNENASLKRDTAMLRSHIVLLSDSLYESESIPMFTKWKLRNWKKLAEDHGLKIQPPSYIK